jgi:hypothetical protein
LRHGIITKKLITREDVFMTDHLDSKNLVPFSKRRNSFQLPGVKKDRDEEMLEQADPNLTPEDEGVIRRYLHYADTLLGSPERDRLTLVTGGGPAKKLAGVPDNLRAFTEATPSVQEENQNGHAKEEPEPKSESSGTDQAA